MKITTKEFYKNNETAYNVLTDYIFEELPQVPLEATYPTVMLDVNLEDCIVDDEGNFFAPQYYVWKTEAGEDEYKPMYSTDPTLTKLQIANMVAEVEEPDLNNPTNFQ